MCPTVRNDQHNKWSRARAEVVDEEAYRLRNSFEGWVETLKKKACSRFGVWQQVEGWWPDYVDKPSAHGVYCTSLCIRQEVASEGLRLSSIQTNTYIIYRTLANHHSIVHVFERHASE